MKLNGKEFKNIAEALDYASAVASEVKVNHYLPFSTDDMIMEMSKGVIAHIWMHCTVGGVSFRLAFTQTSINLYTWQDNRGWAASPVRL